MASRRYRRDVAHSTIITLRCMGEDAMSGCGSLFPISRRNSSLREKDHIKDLYCFKCRCVTKHLEINEFDLTPTEPQLMQKQEA